MHLLYEFSAIDKCFEIYNSILQLKLPLITGEDIEITCFVFLFICFYGLIKILVNESKGIHSKKQTAQDNIKEDLLSSMAISLVTGSFILGLASGGSVAGSLAGDSLSTDSSND